MIVDTLDKLSMYEQLNPLFKDVIAFIKENDLNTLEEGKHVIKEGELFVNIQIAKGKLRKDAFLETHRTMIDIQIPLATKEQFGWTPLCNLPDLAYDKDKDMTKYYQPAETYFDVKPGEFAIFFPQDGHAPCISNEETFRKAIFKVKY